MHLIFKFLILIWIFEFTSASVTPTKPNETVPKIINANIKNNIEETESKQREKRQLTYIPNNSPVYFDPAQQQSGLLGFGQNIPIIGTLVSGLPILGNGQNLLGGLTGNLGNGLGGLTGNLGNGLGGLTNGLTGTLGNLGGGLGNLGLGNLGLFGGSAPSTTNAASCPAGQKLSCRCESLIPIKPLGTRKDHNDIIEIEDQRIKGNTDGSTEVIAHLSNGLTMYQKTNSQEISKEINGYFTLKVADQRYLTIYYSIDDLDYTVKADVNIEPPKTNIGIAEGHQNLSGTFP